MANTTRTNGPKASPIRVLEDILNSTKAGRLSADGALDFRRTYCLAVLRRAAPSLAQSGSEPTDSIFHSGFTYKEQAIVSAGLLRLLAERGPSMFDGPFGTRAISNWDAVLNGPPYRQIGISVKETKSSKLRTLRSGVIEVEQRLSSLASIDGNLDKAIAQVIALCDEAEAPFARMLLAPFTPQQAIQELRDAARAVATDSSESKAGVPLPVLQRLADVSTRARNWDSQYARDLIAAPARRLLDLLETVRSVKAAEKRRSPETASHTRDQSPNRPGRAQSTSELEQRPVVGAVNDTADGPPIRGGVTAPSDQEPVAEQVPRPAM